MAREFANDFLTLFQFGIQQQEQRKIQEAELAQQNRELGLLDAFRTKQLVQEQTKLEAPNYDVFNMPGGGAGLLTTGIGMQPKVQTLVEGVIKESKPNLQLKNVDTGGQIIQQTFDPTTGETKDIRKIGKTKSPSSADTKPFEFSSGTLSSISNVINPSKISITGDPITPLALREEQLNQFTKVKSALGGEGFNFFDRLEKESNGLPNPRTLIDRAEKALVNGEISTKTADRIEALIPYYNQMYESLSRPVKTKDIE